jgi:hypothetical protein
MICIGELERMFCETQRRMMAHNYPRQAERGLAEQLRCMGTDWDDMTRPNIQIDDEVREMTEEEYAALIESGWTETPPEEATEE